MLLKGVRTEVNGNVISVNFPDKKTIVLRGSNGLQLIHIIECLLFNDFTGYYFEFDKMYGFNYQPVTGVSQLAFNSGSIFGKDKAIHIEGTIPKVHCIRYLGACNKIRSAVISDDLTYSELYTDTTVFSNALSTPQWMRLITLVNSYFGYQMARIDKGSLCLSFLPTGYDMNMEQQEFIYMLISECFLTPPDYTRVLLLPNIPFLSGKRQADLLELLDNISGHSLTLSTGNIQPSDLDENSVVSFLNI